MARQIDPFAMTEADVAYVRVRPMLRREFIMQGLGDPLDPDYEYLVLGDEEPDEEEDESSSNPEGETPEEPDEETGDDDETEDDESEEESEESVDYDEMSKKDLEALINKRNEGRDEGDLIKPEGRNKTALAHALREDDSSE